MERYDMWGERGREGDLISDVCMQSEKGGC